MVRIQGKSDSHRKRPRMLTLRSLSFMLLLLYLLALLPGITFGLENCSADNCNHDIIKRLTYNLENPYRLRKAQMAVSEAALACSGQFGIGLNTPITHRILDANLHPADAVRAVSATGELSAV